MASADIGIQVEVSLLKFQFSEVGLRELIKGDITADLIKRAIRVVAAAKINASHTPPSVPGSGPAVRTGRLRGSITYRIGEDPISPYIEVGSAVTYAPYVEFGTSRMAARPYLRPALEAVRL